MSSNDPVQNGDERELQLRRDLATAKLQLLKAQVESNTAIAELKAQQDAVLASLEYAARVKLDSLEKVFTEKEDQLKQHIHADNFIKPNTKLLVHIQAVDHPLFTKNGCINALYERPGCPFASHQGHIHVKSCQSHTVVEIEAWHTSGYVLKALPWTKKQYETARIWLEKELIQLASEPAGSCPVTPYCKSIFRHPTPAPGDW